MPAPNTYLRIRGPLSKAEQQCNDGAYQYQIQFSILSGPSSGETRIKVSLKTYNLEKEGLVGKFHRFVSGRNADGSEGPKSGHKRMHQKLVDTVNESSNRTAEKIYSGVSAQDREKGERVQDESWICWIERAQKARDHLWVNNFIKHNQADDNVQSEASAVIRYSQTWVGTSSFRFHQLFRSYLTTEIVKAVNELQPSEGLVCGTISYSDTPAEEKDGLVWLRHDGPVGGVAMKESARTIKSEWVANSKPCLPSYEFGLENFERDWAVCPGSEG